MDYTETGATTVPVEDVSSEELSPAPTQAPTEEVAQADKTSLSALVTDMQDIEAKDYSEETSNVFSAALSDAQSVLANEAATQEQVDAAETALNEAFAALEPADNNLLFIIIGIVAAVIVIVIVVVVVVVGKKKKPAVESNSYAYDAPIHNNQQPAQSGFAPVTPVTPATTPVQFAGASGVGETSVLNQGAGETTVLNQGS